MIYHTDCRRCRDPLEMPWGQEYDACDICEACDLFEAKVLLLSDLEQGIGDHTRAAEYVRDFDDRIAMLETERHLSLALVAGIMKV